MYILECSNGKYYVGSTNDLHKRLEEHQQGLGANFTSKYNPVRLVYFEEHERVEDAFIREKQVQGWSRKKKETLMFGTRDKLNGLASCKNETHYRYYRESKVEEGE